MAPIEKMQCYQKNNCRLCSQVFCCQECRIRHEQQSHGVNPDCELCIYGRMTIKDASVTLLNHIKSAHWPLHCVFCKKVFSSLDDLIPHDKCSVRMENMKIQSPTTPVTPVTESNEPSPMITPFYKSNIPGNLQPITSSISMAITSTPLHKAESEDKTPANACDIKSIYKSSLKLTGSSNLSDSKKSERRVTFCETPTIGESCCRKSKYLPEEKQTIKEHLEDANESDDDSYVSFTEDEFFNSESSRAALLEDKENKENQLPVCHKDSTASVWESALTNLEVSKKCELINKSVKHINVSLQINVFNETIKSEEESLKLNSLKDDTNDSLNTTTSIWSSMTSIVKSVMNNISFTAKNSPTNGSTKRSQPDNDSVIDGPLYKKMKLTEIRCRRPIREISPLYHIRLAKPKYVDKATQTDDDMWF